MTRSIPRVLPLAALAAFVLSGPALAQESTTRGLHVAFHLTGAALSVEEDDRADGAGAGITVGYGVNRIVMPFVQFEGAGFMVENGTIEGEWTMAHVDVGARFHFASTLRSWVPYLQAAFTGRRVEVNEATFGTDTDAEVAFNGGGLSLGGGLLVYPWETVAFELQLMMTGGNFTEFEVNNVTFRDRDIDATSSRLSVGVSWWP